MKVLNFAILPIDRELNNTLIDTSRFFNDVNNSNEFVLGDKNIPHLTILQIETDEEPKIIWDKVKNISDSISIDLQGLCFITSSDNDLWAEIPIKKTNFLSQIQLKAIDLLEVPAKLIKNGTGDNFRPHISLGLLSNNIHPNMIDINYDVFRRKNVKCKFVLGLSGENFTFSQTLFD